MMDRHDYAKACPKFAESHRLDPGVGTLLNLADCYEQLGKTASAWAAYIEAETLARRLDQRPRAEFAEKRARELAGGLARLSIEVAKAKDAAAPDVTVRRDGETLERPAWGTLVPVDPGEHRVEASAPGFETFVKTIVVQPGQRAAISVPALRPAPSPSRGGAQRTAGLVIAGVGLVAAGVGVGFGAIAKSKNDEALNDFCGPVACTQRGADLIGEAQDAATISTVLVISGAVALVGGSVLFLSAPSAAGSKKTGLHFGPTSIGGSF